MVNKELNKLVKDNQKLIYKIVHQWYKKVNMPWDDLYSMALEGFAKAIREYDPEKSKMKFGNYCAYAMRNNILIHLPREANIVTLNSYSYEKVKDTPYLNVSMSKVSGEGQDEASREYKHGLYCDMDDSLHGELIGALYKNLGKRDAEILMQFYGLGNFEKTKGTELAVKYDTSAANISSKICKIRSKLKKNQEVIGILQDIVESYDRAY